MQFSSTYDSGDYYQGEIETKRPLSRDPEVKPKRSLIKRAVDAHVTNELKTELGYLFGSSPGNARIETWNSFASYFEGISYDEISAFIDPNGTGDLVYDPVALSGDIICDIRNAGSGIKAIQDVHPVLCTDGGDLLRYSLHACLTCTEHQSRIFTCMQSNSRLMPTVAY